MYTAHTLYCELGFRGEDTGEACPVAHSYQMSLPFGCLSHKLKVKEIANLWRNPFVFVCIFIDCSVTK